MLDRSHKLLPILFIWFALAMSGAAQSPDYQNISNMEREVTRLLLEKDVGKLANQMARERATTVVPLLRRLTVFASAGHRARVLQTLKQLAQATDMPPLSHRWVVAETIRQLIGIDDLEALKAYYEFIMPVDAQTAEPLLRLWEKEGDTKMLDAWLAARTEQHSDWLRWRIYWRAKSGTAGTLLDALASEVKNNPGDRTLLFRYLQANEAANHLQNISWLADVLKPGTAYESYEFGMMLKNDAPLAAAKLLERSLNQPFNAEDIRLITERVIPRFQIPPRVKNWEKQLRFWTKRQLAELYKATNQPQAAQLVIQELVDMKGDDIILEDVHSLAGAVQAASGMRVVETKILRDEAAEKESATYWTERARYYMGRKEYDAVMDAYRSALHHLPFKPQDKTSANARLMLLKDFAIFAASRNAVENGKQEERRAEIKQVLWREFHATPPETDYAFGVAQIIIDYEFEFNDLMDSLFVSQMDVPARMLAARDVWGIAEERFIDYVVCRSSLTPAQKASYWTQLEALTKSGSPTRAFYLADMMVSCNEPRRAIPLLVNYLEQVRGRKLDENDPGEWHAEEKLFTAYLNTDDWQAAEKLLFKRDNLRAKQIMYDLTRISLVAAQTGAVDDAVRLWRIKSNLDRRYLEGLDKLAATKAKEPLRQMYQQMKRSDPLSSVPDAALKLLQ
jgi:tetratricopeptide (TPR) repeat protein